VSCLQARSQRERLSAVDGALLRRDHIRIRVGLEHKLLRVTAVYSVRAVLLAHNVRERVACHAVVVSRSNLVPTVVEAEDAVFLGKIQQVLREGKRCDRNHKQAKRRVGMVLVLLLRKIAVVADCIALDLNDSAVDLDQPGRQSDKGVVFNNILLEREAR